MGILAIGIAVWLIVGLVAWWRFIPAVLLLMFGLPSLKTAVFASDQEIKELTGERPLSDDTRKKFDDRI